MIRKGKFYKVGQLSEMYDPSYPGALKEVRVGTIVKSLESGSEADVDFLREIKVMLKSGETRKVYKFQLIERQVKDPKDAKNYWR